MTRPALAATVAFIGLAAAAALLAARTHYTTDLSAFLPRTPTASQRVLIEQLREGPAARLIIAALGGGDAATRAHVSAALAQGLRTDPRFAAVSNGDAPGLQADREFLFRHRYLLSEAVTPQRFTANGLHEAIAGSLAALAAPEGLLLKELFVQDPTGELLAIVDALGPERAPRSNAGVWNSRDGTLALLVLQTRAAGADTDAQQAACEAVRQAFARARDTLPAAQRSALTLRLTGPPVFAVDARVLIKHEVMRLSMLGAVLITVLLLFVYRSLPALLLGLVPVASGALAGIAAVALGFGAVHGITLGFGVTLIGEAVDYSIYLFVQRGPDWRHTVWPTIRLGVLTSIVGFAALLPSDFQGLAQLGLYSIAGLTAAALVTRFVLPHWLPAGFAIRDLRAAGAALQQALARLRTARVLLWGVPLLAGTVLYLHRGALLNHELAALSPVSVPDQEFDERLRADLGAADVRYMVVAPAPTREAALSAAQSLTARLAPLVESGVIAGVEAASRYLPSAATQRARQESLPERAVLEERLRAAVEGLPVSPERLQPFVEAIAAARAAPLLARADLEGTSFAAVTDALLVQDARGFSALLPVAAVASGDLTEGAVAAVRRVVAAGSESAVLLNLKGETDQLYSSYLAQAIRLSLAGFAAIVVLLGITLRSAARVARVLTPLALAVVAVAGLLVAAGATLTILHLIGMLLIVAVGSNYALFFDRSSAGDDGTPVALTLVSLLVANLATVLAFGVLAFSRVPVLSDLGATVAPGAALALFFCALLSQPPPPAASAGRVA